MKRALPFIAALVPLLLLALPSASIAPVASAADGASSVWRIQGPEGRLYLAGSIHVLRPDDYPLPAAYDSAWEDSSTLYLELPPEDLDPLRVQAVIAELALVGPDSSLDDFIRGAGGQRQVDEVHRHAADVGVGLAMFQSYRPWFAAISVMQLVMLRAGFDPSLGVDRHFQLRAQREGRTVLGLERLEDQLGIFAGLPADQEVELLLSILRDAGALDEQVLPLLQAWRSGDERSLADLLDDSFEGYPELEHQIVIARNRAWIRELRPLLERPGSHLVVVGALHLVGEHGLVRAFRREGYTITQL